MAHIKLENCKNEQEVKMLAANILGNGEWEKLSQPLFELFLLKNWKEQKGINDVVEDFWTFDDDINKLLKNAGVESRTLFEQYKTSPSMYSSVMATISASLNRYKQKA